MGGYSTLRSTKSLLAICFMLVSCLDYSFTLKMEAICSFETSVDFQRSTLCYIAEDRSLHNHRSENLKSCKCIVVFACHTTQVQGCNPNLNQDHSHDLSCSSQSDDRNNRCYITCGLDRPSEVRYVEHLSKPTVSLIEHRASNDRVIGVNGIGNSLEEFGSDQT
jgi:hypothetical protein